MAADGEEITTVKELLQFSVAQLRILFVTIRLFAAAHRATHRATHRLYRDQAINLAGQQGFERQMSVVLGFSMRLAQQTVQIGISALILRHQRQSILQDQGQVMIALQVYLSTIIQLETLMMPLFLLFQVLEFTVTTRKPIGTIKIINTQRLVTKATGRFNQITRMRCTL